MPWIHLHAGYKGKVTACCVANIPFGNVNEQNLDEIWNGEAIQTIREKFLRNESDPRCASCISVEASGNQSIRQETILEYGGSWLSNPNSNPIYFDIRFSNLCNYTCRTCWHGASSSWFEEAKELKNTAGDSAIIQNITDYELFFERYQSVFKTAKAFYFAGGEPLIMKEHFHLVSWLAENNPSVSLRYNTNLSSLTYKNHSLLSLWKKFRKVSILVSLDGIGQGGEYIRKGMNWEKVEANLEAILQQDAIQIQIAPTVSLLNVFHLPEMYTYLKRRFNLKVGDWYLNFLERPFHYNVKALPAEMKQSLVKHYDSFDFESEEKKMFQAILDFVNQEDLSNYYTKFKQYNGQLDQLRDEAFDTINWL